VAAVLAALLVVVGVAPLGAAVTLEAAPPPGGNQMEGREYIVRLARANRSVGAAATARAGAVEPRVDPGRALADLEAVTVALERLAAGGGVDAWEILPRMGYAVVRGGLGVAEGLQHLPEVDAVWESRRHALLGAQAAPFPGLPLGSRRPASAELAAPRPAEVARWNLELAGAPGAWQRGVTGEGVVIAFIDTGVDRAHPALRHGYRGRHGEHAVSWIDLVAASPAQRTPVDVNGHGTHVAGIALGRDWSDGGVAYGVAPGAEWIAARAFDGAGVATDARLLRAAEWVLAPGGPESGGHRPRLRPDIVNCSWTLENSADPLMTDMLEAWRAAGILPVFAVGNTEAPASGSAHHSVMAPAGSGLALSVGAVGPDGSRWPRSRVGPGFGGATKPDLVAPGAGITSADRRGGYAVRSGTSMAAPHVAGAAALVASARPELDAARVAQFLGGTARAVDPPAPDAEHGWGVVDASAAVDAALSAGRARGTVSRAGATIAGARIQARVPGEPAALDTPWWALTGPDGSFDLALPAGAWTVSAGAGADVASARLDIDLPARGIAPVALDLEDGPVGSATGRVRSTWGRPISGAVVAALPGPLPPSAARYGVARDPAPAAPDSGPRELFENAPRDVLASAVSGPDGRFALELGDGRRTLAFLAVGHRALTRTVDVVAGSSSDASAVLPPAPRTLLVDADASAAKDERIWPYVSRALDDSGWPHAVAEVRAGGIGLPATDTLSAHDLVVWLHLNESPGSLDRQLRDRGRPVTGAMLGFLERGGRLLLGGRNVAAIDAAEGPPGLRRAPDFTRRALGVVLVDGFAGFDGVRGESWLDGLDLRLDWPGGRASAERDRADRVRVAPETEAAGIAEVVARFPDGGPAGITLDGPLGRRVFFAFGLEAAGGRHALARVVGRQLEWLAPPDLRLVPPAEPVPTDGEGSGSAPLRVDLYAPPVDQTAELQLAWPVGLEADALPDGFAPSAFGATWRGSLPRGVTRSLAVRLRSVPGSGLPGGRHGVTAALVAGRLRLERSADFELSAPNLGPSRLGVTPARPADDGTLSLTATLRNDGAEPAEGGRLALGPWPDGFVPDVGSAAVDRGEVAWLPDGLVWAAPVPAGGSASLELDGLLAAAPGSGEEPSTFVGELADGRGWTRQLTATARAGAPRLSLSAVDGRAGGAPWPSIELRPEEARALSLAVRNDGPTAVEHGSVTLDAGPEVDVEPRATAIELAPGGTTTVTISLRDGGPTATMSLHDGGPTATMSLRDGGLAAMLADSFDVPGVAPDSAAAALTVVLDDDLAPRVPVTEVIPLAPLRPDVSSSRLVFAPAAAASGQAVTATLLLANSGDITAALGARAAIPPSLAVAAGSLRADRGSASLDPGQLQWRVDVPPGGAARLSIEIRPSNSLPLGSLVDLVPVLVGPGIHRRLTATLSVNPIDLASSRLEIVPRHPPPGSRLKIVLSLVAEGRFHPQAIEARTRMPEAVELGAPSPSTRTQPPGEHVFEAVLAPGPESAPARAWFARVPDDLPAGVPLRVVSSIGPRGEQLAALETTSWIGSADLLGSLKTASAAAGLPGETVAFRIRLARSADSPAWSVTDRLPAGLRLLPDSVAASGGHTEWDAPARRLRWWPPPGPGLHQLSYAAQLEPDAAGVLANIARVDVVPSVGGSVDGGEGEGGGGGKAQGRRERADAEEGADGSEPLGELWAEVLVARDRVYLPSTSAGAVR